MRLIGFVLIMAALVMNGCKGNSDTSKGIDGDTLTMYSSYLTLVDCGDFSIAEVRAPWSDTVAIGRYAILRAGVGDVKVPDGYSVIQSPLNRSIVFSSAYTAAIDELGCIGRVKGVADGNYYLPNDTISKLIEAGAVADIGSSLAPLIEKAVEIEPDAILLSPYAGGSSTGLERLGVPMIWMADYLEKSPLGRAEWLLLLGELYGESALAKDTFETTKKNYEEIRSRVSGVSDKPVVITEKPMSGVWYVPGGGSYIARMIEDAGAVYPWADTDESGSVPLDEASVIDRGGNADLWLIKDIRNYNVKDILDEVPRAKALQPFPDNIYCCNTLATPYYNVIAFHPDRVLADMAAIFHPGIFKDYILEFYQHLE